MSIKAQKNYIYWTESIFVCRLTWRNFIEVYAVTRVLSYALTPLKINRRFGRHCRLHLQGRIVGQPRNQLEAVGEQDSSFRHEAYRQTDRRTGLPHSVQSTLVSLQQKTHKLSCAVGTPRQNRMLKVLRHPGAVVPWLLS
jgi:hypothetical protein